MSHMYKSIIHGNAIIWAEKGRRQPWPVSNLTFKNQRQKLCSGLILFLKIFAMDAILLTSDCYKKLLFLSHLKGILVRFWTKLNGFTATSHRCPTCCSYNSMHWIANLRPMTNKRNFVWSRDLDPDRGSALQYITAYAKKNPAILPIKTNWEMWK